MLKYFPWIIVAALVLWMPLDSSWNALWVERWGLVILAILYHKILRLWCTLPLKLLLCYLVWITVWPTWLDPVGTLPLDAVLALREAALYQLAVLVAFILYLDSGINFTEPLKWAAWVIFAGILLAVVPGLEVPFLHNPSMAATFVVLGLACHPVTLLAVLVAKSWTAAITLTVGLLYRYRTYTAIVWPFLVMVAVCFYLDPALKIPDNGRFELWSQSFDWWQAHSWPTLWFGTGLGSTRTWLPHVHPDQFFMWLHNDFLQALIEWGVCGCLLASIVVLQSLRTCTDLGLALAFMAAMCTNFVGHWALTALVGWNIILGAQINLANRKSKP